MLLVTELMGFNINTRAGQSSVNETLPSPKLTDEFLNERQKPLIFKPLTKIISRFLRTFFMTYTELIKFFGVLMFICLLCLNAENRDNI